MNCLPSNPISNKVRNELVTTSQVRNEVVITSKVRNELVLTSKVRNELVITSNETFRGVCKNTLSKSTRFRILKTVTRRLKLVRKTP